MCEILKYKGFKVVAVLFCFSDKAGLFQHR